MNTLPLSSLGLHLDADTVRISVSLRLGAKNCEPHKCRCGQTVDVLGLHGFSCLYSAGRSPRHSHLNDIIKRSLAVAGVPSILEPLGLDPISGIRPDGVTVFPFCNGKSLCWDATCSDTFSKSSVIESALAAGSAANKAEDRKVKYYHSLESRYRFIPVSVETSGVYGKLTSRFISELGRRMTAVTGEKREVEWLRQRISIAIMRGNSGSIAATGQPKRT